MISGVRASSIRIEFDFIDDRKVVAALRHLIKAALHVVTKVVKAQLVVGRIGDVGLIGVFFLGGVLIGVNHPRRHPQGAVHLAHPFRVALGKVVVHCDDMHAFAGQRVQIGRKGRDKGLTFTGPHLCDIALVQKDAAHKLHIKGPQPQSALGPLAAVGKSFGQDGIKAFAALLHALFEFFGFGDDAFIAECGELWLQRIDFGHKGAHRFDHTVIRRSKYFARNSSEAQHVFSAWSLLTTSCEALACPSRAPSVKGR